MSGTLRNLITALMGKSRLGGAGAKSTTALAATSFFRWGHHGAWSLHASVKYGTNTMPSRYLVVGRGGEEDADASSGDEGRGRR
jgi:hypothetical protein